MEAYYTIKDLENGQKQLTIQLNGTSHKDRLAILSRAFEAVVDNGLIHCIVRPLEDGIGNVVIEDPQRCPHCQSQLSSEDGRPGLFCTECGYDSEDNEEFEQYGGDTSVLDKWNPKL